MDGNGDDSLLAFKLQTLSNEKTNTNTRNVDTISGTNSNLGAVTASKIKCTNGQFLTKIYAGFSNAYSESSSSAVTLTTAMFTTAVTIRSGLSASQTSTTPGTTCDILPATSSIITAVNSSLGREWAIGEEFSIWALNRCGAGGGFNWLIGRGDSSTIFKNTSATFTLVGGTSADKWYKFDIVRLSSSTILIFHYNF
jgi:hypothetical protein